MSENPMTLKKRADELRSKANRELDEKKRAQMRSLADDLERQYKAALRPHA